MLRKLSEFAELNSLDASELALYGGEEYELVLTVKPEGWDAAKAAVEAVGGQLICPSEKLQRKNKFCSKSTAKNLLLKREAGSTLRVKFSLPVKRIVDYGYA